MSDYEHMSWCRGDHDPDGECRIIHQLRAGDQAYEELAVVLLGVPCDTLTLEVTDCVFDLAELDGLVAALQSFRPAFEARDADVNCEHHNHNDDEAPVEDDEPLDPCDGCGHVPDPYSLWGVNIDGREQWLCVGCCDAAGVPGAHR